MCYGETFGLVNHNITHKETYNHGPFRRMSIYEEVEHINSYWIYAKAVEPQGHSMQCEYRMLHAEGTRHASSYFIHQT